MYKATSILLGLGLVVLWIIGLSIRGSGWLTWLDGVAGVIAIGGAAAFAGGARAGTALAGLLSLGLYALWIIGLAVRHSHWLAWWTFGFACAFLVLAFAGASAATPSQTVRRT